jgi:hypothetical protein
MASSRQRIVVQVTSGLGNQMFSYAAGRGISDRLGAHLSFRRARNLREGVRTYGLCHFRTKVREATLLQQFRIGISLQKPAQRMAQALGPSVARHLYAVIQDQGQGFTPQLFPRDQPMFLRGFWQSEKYFDHIQDQIRNEFAFVLPPREIDRAVLDRIRSTESVAVHVRRGDLVANPEYAAKYYVQEPAYYQAAAQVLRQMGKPLHFFVFSDDPDWPRANLSLGDNVDFECGPAAQGREDWRDLQLMSQCKHHVIANSTFSWWAAWLATFPGKQVIAPRLWVRGSNEPPPDLIPATWKLL